jgi:hypothetical protein
MAAKYELLVASDGQYYFNLKAANGQVILTSERYKEKASATNGIASVQANAADDGRYERKTSANGKPFFVLKAGNGEPIGRSEMYNSTSSMENGIASVKKNGPAANTQDKTAAKG